MSGELEEIHETVKEIKEVLLDPEDGIIVSTIKILIGENKSIYKK